MPHFHGPMRACLCEVLPLAVGLIWFSLAAHDLRAEDTASGLAKYNVVWDSPSTDAQGSMPIGNGDVGVNAWVEPSGDLVFYVSKTDAWDENGRLCKIGRVRVKFDPPLPVAQGFRQELKLREGVIEITAGKSRLVLWVDANQPVVRLEAESDTPVRCRAEVELWRLRERPFGKDDDSHSGGGLSGQAFKPTVLPDVVVTSAAPRVVWYHRNTRSIYPLCLKVQHLEALQDRFPDPLLNLTFGACLAGAGFERAGAQAIQSAKPAHAARTVGDGARREDRHAGGVARAARPAGEAERAGPPGARGVVACVLGAELGLRGGRPVIHPAGERPSVARRRGVGWRQPVPGNDRAPRVIGRALSAEEIAQLAGKERTEEKELRAEELAGGCTVAAWIKPAAGEAGRILDKCTAGRPDGFTFDAHPGLSLRWIVGEYTMIQHGCLQPDEWQHVAATADAASGLRRIYLNGKLVKEERGDPAGETLTRGYVLQRFMNACAGRGGSPIKFNGSIFTVEAKPGASPETPDGDPDWRRWGGNYWFQNTRLAYWPMLAAGDFEMLEPWFRMYRDALPLSKARIETYYKFTNAAQFPETMYWWGLPNNGDYGWNNTAPEPANTYIRRYWNGSLELIAVMLDRYDFTQDEAFARDTLVPLADPLIAFLDQYWQQRDANGKIRLEPAQSLETWHVAVNPLPEIAGLRFLLPRLLALPENVTTAAQRARWTRLLGELPPIPVAEVNGQRLLRPAESFSHKANSENTELYAVFPYRLYGVGRPDLDLARATYQVRGPPAQSRLVPGQHPGRVSRAGRRGGAIGVGTRRADQSRLSLPGHVGAELRLDSRPGPRQQHPDDAAVHAAPE